MYSDCRKLAGKVDFTKWTYSGIRGSPLKMQEKSSVVGQYLLGNDIRASCPARKMQSRLWRRKEAGQDRASEETGQV
jgi:hypothetical protein